MDDFFHNHASDRVADLLQSATIQENLAHFVFNAEKRVRDLEFEREYSGPVEPIALLTELSRLDYNQIADSPSWTPACVYADMLGDMFSDAVIYIGHACDYRGISFLNALALSLDLSVESLIFYDTKASETVAAPPTASEASLTSFVKIGSAASRILDDLEYLTLSEPSIAAALRQLRLLAEDIGVDTEYEIMNAASVWLSMRSDNPLGASIQILCPRT